MLLPIQLHQRCIGIYRSNSIMNKGKPWKVVAVSVLILPLLMACQQHLQNSTRYNRQSPYWYPQRSTAVNSQTKAAKISYIQTVAREHCGYVPTAKFISRILNKTSWKIPLDVASVFCTAVRNENNRIAEGRPVVIKSPLPKTNKPWWKRIFKRRN